MTIEELEIIIKANITDAMDGIKQITNEVKNAVSKSTEPMKQLSNRTKGLASQSASSMSQMKSQMKGYSSSINQTVKQQDYLKSKLADLKDQLKLADIGYEVGDTKKIESEIEKVENKLRKLEGQGKKSGGTIGNIFNFIKDKVKSVGSHILSLSGKIKNLVSHSKNLSKNFSNTFNSGIGSIKKFALSLIGIRAGFSLINKAVSSYLSYDTQLSNSIKNCWNVLGSLLAPILERIINLFSIAVSYVNSFVKALTGIDLVARANTKSLNNQAKASKNANHQLSGIDDLNNLTTSSGGGSSNSESIKVDNVSVDGLLDKLLNYDWYSVGFQLGEKINKALASIDWNFVEKIAVTLSTNLAQLLNGLVAGLDWSLLGSTIGNGINVLLSSIYTFMTTFNWQNLGIGIANGLNSSIETVNWKLLGKTLASKFVALIDTTYGLVNTFDFSKFGTSLSEAVMGFFNEIDFSKAGETVSNGILGLFESVKSLIAGIEWQQLGNDLWVYISSIDWNEIISNLAFVLGQSIAGIGQFIWGFIQEAVNSIAEYWSKQFEEAGGNIIQGLFNGIDDILRDIMRWISDHIVTPFINGFKSLFGIHSPSTVMAELGGYLIQGLFNGLQGIWNTCKEIFENLKTNISTKFSEILSNITSIFSIDNIKNHFEQVLSGIKNVFSSIPNWFKNTFTNAWTNVKNVFSSGGKIFSGIKEGIEQAFKTIVNSLIAGINKIVATPFNAINGMLNKIRNTGVAGVKPFKGLWKENPISVPQIPSLATGGVLDQETLVRVAEYSNAKSNPEIISPIDIMDRTFRNVLSDTDFGTRVDRLCVNVAGENFYDGAIDYINDKSERLGVTVIKEVD